MAHTLYVHGTYMARTWHIHGTYMAHTWYVHGTYMVHTWHIHTKRSKFIIVIRKYPVGIPALTQNIVNENFVVFLSQSILTLILLTWTK
jgi:hypothetical protein